MSMSRTANCYDNVIAESFASLALRVNALNLKPFRCEHRLEGQLSMKLFTIRSVDIPLCSTWVLSNLNNWCVNLHILPFHEIESRSDHLGVYDVREEASSQRLFHHQQQLTGNGFQKWPSWWGSHDQPTYLMRHRTPLRKGSQPIGHFQKIHEAYGDLLPGKK